MTLSWAGRFDFIANMKNIFRILSALFPLLVSSVSAQRLPITMSQIDSLKMPYSVYDLTNLFKDKLPENDPDLVKRKWDIVKNYYALKSAKKELSLLSIETQNLKAIWNLNQKLADKGDITDLQLLASQNTYLNRQIALIAKETECRNYLLEIVRLAFLKIEIEDEQEEKAHSSAD